MSINPTPTGTDDTDQWYGVYLYTNTTDTDDDDEVIDLTKAKDPADLELWINPDMPSPATVEEQAAEINADGVEHECPYPTCSEVLILPGTYGIDMFGFDSDNYTITEQAIIWHQHEGTTRCNTCDEPLYGIKGYRTGGPSL